jgi:hypothetical protein
LNFNFGFWIENSMMTRTAQPIIAQPAQPIAFVNALVNALINLEGATCPRALTIQNPEAIQNPKFFMGAE